MFLHIGADLEVPIKDIIAIVDMQSITQSKITREFMQVAKEEEFIYNISQDTPKSMILTEQNKKSVIYLSPISSITLQKRASFFHKLQGL